MLGCPLASSCVQSGFSTLIISLMIRVNGSHPFVESKMTASRYQKQMPTRASNKAAVVGSAQDREQQGPRLTSAPPCRGISDLNGARNTGPALPLPEALAGTINNHYKGFSKTREHCSNRNNQSYGFWPFLKKEAFSLWISHKAESPSPSNLSTAQSSHPWLPFRIRATPYREHRCSDSPKDLWNLHFLARCKGTFKNSPKDSDQLSLGSPF